MNWMHKWPGPFPVFMDRAEGARLWDVDGNEYVDFCLGDTGAMAGHAPAPVIGVLTERLRQGTTAILPTPDALWVGEELARRFGLPIWQVAMSATDANRFALRLARQITGQAQGPRQPGLNISGVGGTLSGNALSVAAVRATLSTRLTEADFARIVPLASRWASGVRGAIERAGLDWSVTQLGARAEYWLCPRPATASEATTAANEDIEALLHLYSLNRGVLLTPFHNMVLMCPETSADDVDRHVDVFSQAVNELMTA